MASCIPDPGLLSSVTDAIPGDGFLLWRSSDDVGHIEREDLAAVVLAAAGRVLGGHLRAKATAPGNEVGPYGADARLCADSNHDDRFCMECDRMNAGLLVAADLVESACGVPASNQEGQQG